MQSTKVGIREFRENLSSYLESNPPVAITRHGATIGIYVPTKPGPSQADVEALRVAWTSDFKQLRRELHSPSCAKPARSQWPGWVCPAVQ